MKTEVKLKQAFKKLFKWMKGQPLKKQGFTDFWGGESHMKGLKPEIIVTTFTNKSLLIPLSCEAAIFNK